MNLNVEFLFLINLIAHIYIVITIKIITLSSYDDDDDDDDEQHSLQSIYNTHKQTRTLMCRMDSDSSLDVYSACILSLHTTCL